MANVVTIEAEARARAGKGAARATRRAGKVPGVIYGARQAPTLIALEPRAVLRELQRAGWQSRLYEIKTNGDATRALIRDVQFHPVTDAPEHVDFQRLAPGEPIRVSVPVHFDNEGLSPGLKRGGVLNVIRHTVEVYTEPEHIPEQFTAEPRGPGLQRCGALGGPEGHREHALGRSTAISSSRPWRRRRSRPRSPPNRLLQRHRWQPWLPPLRRRHRHAARPHAAGPAADAAAGRSGADRPQEIGCHAALGRPRQSGAGDGPEPAQYRLHGAGYDRDPPWVQLRGDSASRV